MRLIELGGCYDRRPQLSNITVLSSQTQRTLCDPFNMAKRIQKQLSKGNPVVRSLESKELKAQSITQVRTSHESVVWGCLWMEGIFLRTYTVRILVTTRNQLSFLRVPLYRSKSVVRESRLETSERRQTLRFR